MYQMNGHTHSDLGLGVLLGQLISQSGEQTILLREIRDAKVAHGAALTRLSEEVARVPSAVAAALPKPSPQARTPLLQRLREWTLVAYPIAFLMALAAGKVTWAELAPHLLPQLGRFLGAP